MAVGLEPGRCRIGRRCRSDQLLARLVVARSTTLGALDHESVEQTCVDGFSCGQVAAECPY